MVKYRFFKEVSFFLYEKMRPLITEKTWSVIHHHIILNEIRALYNCNTRKQINYWHNELLSIRRYEYFSEQNALYFYGTYGKFEYSLLCNKTAVVDRYLTDMNLHRLLLELQIRKNLLLCIRLRNKFVRKQTDIGDERQR